MGSGVGIGVALEMGEGVASGVPDGRGVGLAPDWEPFAPMLT